MATSVWATSDSAPRIDERAAVSPEQERAHVSFDDVYSDYVEFVWRSALRLGVHESAVEDVVQQVFLTVHKSLHRFEWRSTMKTWVFSILLRVMHHYRRTIRRKSPHLEHDPVDPDLLAAAAHNPDEALSRAEASRIIDCLLESLEGDKRIVFVMAELEEMTAAEIAFATGLAPNVVYSRLRAARTDFERAAAALRRRERWGVR